MLTLIERKLKDDVYQDGGDFYSEEQGYIDSYIISVSDHDTAMAYRARDWFKNYHPEWTESVEIKSPSINAKEGN